MHMLADVIEDANDQAIAGSFTRITTGHSPRRQSTSRVGVAIGVFLSHNTQTALLNVYKIVSKTRGAKVQARRYKKDPITTAEN